MSYLNQFNSLNDNFMSVENFINYNKSSNLKNKDREDFTVDEIDSIEGIDSFKNLKKKIKFLIKL